MIWSIVKILGFIALVAAIAFGVIGLLEAPGLVSVRWGGEIYEMQALVFAGLTLLALAALWLLFKALGLILAVLRFLHGDETAISRFFQRRRAKKGLDVLSRAFLSLESGDARKATRLAEKAEMLLDNPRLTRLLNARAAQMNGDLARAAGYFEAMAKDSETAFVGVRGLLAQALRKGDDQAALTLAKRAAALKPKSEEVLNTLFDLQSRVGDWSAARATIEAGVSAKLLTRDVGKRRRAVLSLAEARKAQAAGDADAALKLALDAVKGSPGLTPAAALAARLLTAQGGKRKAARILADAWRGEPHPDLAAAFAAIAPDETPAARRKRFRALFDANPGHAQSRLLATELAIADKDWPAARKALGDLSEGAPAARAFALMAAIENGDGGSEAEVRAWLARALSAPKDPQWTCAACGRAADDWEPVCDHCDAFDTIAWVEGDAGSVSESDSAAMLPLLIGADEPPLDAEAAAEEASDVADVAKAHAKPAKA